MLRCSYIVGGAFGKGNEDYKKRRHMTALSDRQKQKQHRDFDSEPTSVMLMPGEQVPEVEDFAKSKKVVLGPGLRRVNESVLACKAGILCKKEPNLFWIDSYQQRYVPVRGECVLGVVTQKSGDIFRVDVGAHEQACLSYLAFEGATKKNRPDIQVGDLLYARLIVASRDLEPEIVCVNSHGKKEKLGVLNDGFVFNCSINLIRKVLSKKCPLLQALQREMPFELAVGMNGRVWIKAKTTRETIAVGNAILATEFVSNDDIKKMCENIGNILFT